MDVDSAITDINTVTPSEDTTDTISSTADHTTFTSTEASEGTSSTSFPTSTTTESSATSFSTSVSTSVTTLTESPENWLPFGNNCYLAVNESVDFEIAQKHCESVDSDLTSVLSEEENNFIYSCIVKEFLTDTWIGLNGSG